MADPARVPVGRNLAFELDAMHLLPLEIIPFQTTALRNALLIKNVALESMVEVFNDTSTGSGQIEPSQVKRYLPNAGDVDKEDLILLARLALMQSFDIYSLRIQLRQLGLDVDSLANLRLSPSKQGELDRFMNVFTRPLAVELVGRERARDLPASVLLELAGQRADAEVARNIRRFSQRLNIVLQKLPDFIQAYGDVFLSIAFFENEYDAIRADLRTYLDESRMQRGEAAGSGAVETVHLLEKVEKILAFASMAVEERLKNCHVSAESLWEDVNLAKFERTRLTVEGNHIALGSLLCGLSVKVRTWKEVRGGGGRNAVRFPELVREIMVPGLQSLLRTEKTAQLNVVRREGFYKS